MAKRSDITDAEILAACRAFHEQHAPTPDIALADKYPAKVIMAKMEQMAKRGLIEYGVSLRTAWVVDEPAQSGLNLRGAVVALRLEQAADEYTRNFIANGAEIMRRKSDRPDADDMTWSTKTRTAEHIGFTKIEGSE